MMAAGRGVTLPLRLHLTLFYTVVLVAVVGAFAADVWWVEGRIGVGRVDRELGGLSASVSTLLREELGESTPLRAAATEICEALSTPDRALAFFDAGGRPIAASWDGLAQRGAPSVSGDADVRSVALDRGAWRLRTEPRLYGNIPLTVVLGASLRDVARQKHEVVETMWIALPLALLLAGGGGW